MADKEKQDKGEKKPKQQQAGGEKKARKPKGEGQQAEAPVAETGPVEPAPTPRLYERYRKEIVPVLQEKFGQKNRLALPRLEKIVISMGLGKAVTAGEKGKIEQAEKELAVIAGQRPVRCKAKKAVANFKVRIGMETGLKVTLRGARMYEFMDRLIALAIPRVKDFRGLSATGFDNAGNYNFGFTEQSVFPEVMIGDQTTQQGMNITIVTTAGTPERGRELLRQFGMPFGDPTSNK